MSKSLDVVTGAFATLFAVRTIRQIERVTAESLKLAASMHGPLADSARTFLTQFENLQTSFELGLATGFLEDLNVGLLGTAENLHTAADAGKFFGQILGKVAADSGQFFGRELPNFIKEVIAQYDELMRVSQDFSQLLRGDLTVLTGGISSFAKTIPGKESTDAVAAYGTAAELAAMEQERFWQAVVNTTADGEIYLDQLNNNADALAKLQTPNEQYAAALERIERLHLSGEAAARAHQSAVAGLASDYLSLAGQAGSALTTLFNENKGVAVATAVINTAGAIMKTLETYGATPWGLAASAVAAATGAAQIATILSAQPGTSKKPSASSSATSAAKSSAASGGGGRAPSQAVTINLMGSGMFTRDQVRSLAEQLNGLVSDGATIRVA